MTKSTMKATLALLLPALVAANPQYIQCDLTGSQTAPDLTVATTIMGGAVVDSAAIAAPSGTTYSANTVLTWTWDQALLTQGFIKASAGAITGLSGTTSITDCVAPAVAQWSSASRAPLHPTSAATLLRSRHALSGVSLPPRLSLLAATCTGHARVPTERERMLTPAIAASTPLQAALAPPLRGPRRRTFRVSRR